MFVVTLIADDGLDDELVSEVAYQFDMDCTAGALSAPYTISGDGSSGEFPFEAAAAFDANQCAELSEAIKEQALAIAQGGFRRRLDLDVVVQKAAAREKRLLVADMDSTMITVECIDELADYAGLKAEVAAITDRAMRGELDFEAALRARVALLAGLDEAVLGRCREERVRITPGAETLVRTMKARGATTILVSGGFTHFADAVGAEIGFDRVVANRLEIVDGTLTGGVMPPIVGAETKKQVLLDACAELGIGAERSLAVGDGANDIPMLQAAGLGLAYHAKPAARKAADAVITHSDLTALLYAQGIPQWEWVTG